MKRLFVFLLILCLAGGLFSCDELLSSTAPATQAQTVATYERTVGLSVSQEKAEAKPTEELSVTEELGEVLPQAHVHEYSAATCESPKTCVLCGHQEGAARGHSYLSATCESPKACVLCDHQEGLALGHSYLSATCEHPKTCTRCGDQDGAALGHRYSDGECTRCGEEDPDFTGGTMVWIPTKGGKKYHSNSGCSNMKGPDRVSVQTARARGFTPCKKCY